MTHLHELREPDHVPAFTFRRRRFGPGYVTEVTHPAGTRVVIADQGATLLSWRSTTLGEAELTDGYASPAELVEQDGVRNGILAPFSNRIALGRYVFAGVTYDLLQHSPTTERLVYHGFLRNLEMEFVGATAGAEEMALTFHTAAIRPGRFPGYPFSLDITVVYSVTVSGIELAISGRNVGSVAAPYGSGWHPYFRLPGRALDQLVLRVPAHVAIVADEDLIPLAGDAATAAVDTVPHLDFRRPRSIAGLILDTCYADHDREADGKLRSYLYDPGTGASIAVWQDRGLVHVFSGDTLARGRRQSLAIEPVELMTDAFNRPECDELSILAPGETRTFCCGATAARIQLASAEEPPVPTGR